jgi:hypothetical protein
MLMYKIVDIALRLSQIRRSSEMDFGLFCAAFFVSYNLLSISSPKVISFRLAIS